MVYPPADGHPSINWKLNNKKWSRKQNVSAADRVILRAVRCCCHELATDDCCLSSSMSLALRPTHAQKLAAPVLCRSAFCDSLLVITLCCPAENGQHWQWRRCCSVAFHRKSRVPELQPPPREFPNLPTPEHCLLKTSQNRWLLCSDVPNSLSQKTKLISMQVRYKQIKMLEILLVQSVTVDSTEFWWTQHSKILFPHHAISHNW